MHYWIVEHDIIDTAQSEKHRNLRNQINDNAIGNLSVVEVKTVKIQGVEIAKPSWFTEDTNLEQLPQLRRGRRR